MHGGGSGTRVELALPEGEYVTTVEGTFSDGAISKIQVETNKGVFPPLRSFRQQTDSCWHRHEVGSVRQGCARDDVRVDRIRPRNGAAVL